MKQFPPFQKIWRKGYMALPAFWQIVGVSRNVLYVNSKSNINTSIGIEDYILLET